MPTIIECAREDSNLTSENLANDIENKENEGAAICSASKCASLLDKSEQFTELLQALKALTQDERSALLQALSHE